MVVSYQIVVVFGFCELVSMRLRDLRWYLYPTYEVN